MVMPWTRGVPDRRGAGSPASFAGAGGDGRTYCQALVGRLGQSSWRLPAMKEAFGAEPAQKSCVLQLSAAPTRCPPQDVVRPLQGAAQVDKDSSRRTEFW